MTENKAILLYGHGGYSNRGCEAIIRTTVDMFRRHFPRAKIEVASFEWDTDSIRTIEGVDSYVAHTRFLPLGLKLSNILFHRILHRVGPSDVMSNREVIEHGLLSDGCISVGGDNYCYAPPYWLYAIDRALKRAEKPLILWGCSIEPSKITPDMLADLRLFDLITCRESITYEALMNAGIIANTHLFPDPAFTLEGENVDLPEGFRQYDTVGINVSPLVMKLENGESITYRNYAMLLQYIIKQTDMQVALIPHVIEGTDNNDLIPLAELYKQFKDTGRVVLIGDGYNCMQLKGLISRCRMFVGARTHATIAAYSTCVPTLVLGYSVKSKGIARDIFGSEDKMVVPVQSLKREDDLIEAFQYIMGNEDSIRKHLMEFIPSYAERAWLAADKVKELLGNKIN